MDMRDDFASGITSSLGPHQPSVERGNTPVLQVEAQITNPTPPPMAILSRAQSHITISLRRSESIPVFRDIAPEDDWDSTDDADANGPHPTNQFGVWHEYHGTPPSYNPEALYSLLGLSNSRNISRDMSSDRFSRPAWSVFGSGSISRHASSSDNWYSPFPNPTSFLIMSWLLSGSKHKTFAEADDLVQNVLLHPEFDSADLESF